MGVNRRGFLKAAGVSALGLVGGKAAVEALTGKEAIASSSKSNDKKAGIRQAMVIDLRKCKAASGCKDCMNACHLSHNVPEFNNAKDEIKWIWPEKFKNAFTEQEHNFVDEKLMKSPIPILCNHCDNPPCVRVCPTQSTFKRPDGIVVMDWHRCIGCRYCMAACPYGSRSFNWRDPRPAIGKITKEYPTRSHGVVEKCTFCDERLAENKMPYCVDACKEKAIVFGDLEKPDSEIRTLLKSRFSIRRKPGLGTQPEVYYLV